MTNEMFKIVSAIRSDVYKQLEDKMYESEIYNLGITDITEEVVMEYLNKILVDEKLRKKLSGSVSKTILEKSNKKQQAYKIQRSKDMRLWKVTNGKIPCLCECGYHETRTKEEVLSSHGSNNFICASCSKKNGDSEAFKIFDTKNVYSIFGIN